MRFDTSGPHEVVYEDVEYASPGGVALLARVYRPADASAGPFPALVDVHGGAWCYFDRTADAYFDRLLAACGVVVVALDFRQGGEHPFPASLDDVVAGVRYTRANAARLGVRPDAIGLIGGSSGGHLALLAAMRRDVAAAFVLALWPIADPLARYHYVVARIGEIPAPDRDRMFDPERLARAQETHFRDEATMARASVVRVLEDKAFECLPPLWVAHPERDENVTLEMTERLVAAYRHAGGEAELEVFAGVGHGFANFPGADADRGVARMRDWLGRALARSARE